ncbi:DUF1493 family protein [Shewanella pneumatophori]|uniref:DUF1493 family protein n=1 Tax=Shewanella pneumatophori TaxID=314092 RepID=A0A9X1ZA58_9GAMM|nr:DUF1493 family protein [Shewanella pneumatophori]MCL1137726.1 DUF1493 family protein [Shewanella pneumatophori]
MPENNTFNSFINDSGLSDYYKSNSDLELRLYHDLNIYGDIAESCIETLSDNYGVDISSFRFGDYFPEEFSGKSHFQKMLFSLIPFLRASKEDKADFKPLTFLMLKNAIDKGRLV